MMSENSIHSNHPSGYEKRDVGIRSVVITSIVSIIVIILMIIFLFDFFIMTKEAVIHEQTLVPVSQDLIDLRKSEDSILTTYEMIDSTNKTYRIPIERAKDIYLAESAGTK